MAKQINCPHCNTDSAAMVGGIQGAREVIPAIITGVPLGISAVIFVRMLERLPYCSTCRRRIASYPAPVAVSFFASLFLAAAIIILVFWALMVTFFEEPGERQSDAMVAVPWVLLLIVILVTHLITRRVLSTMALSPDEQKQIGRMKVESTEPPILNEGEACPKCGRKLSKTPKGVLFCGNC